MSWEFLDQPVFGLYTLTGSELLTILVFMALFLALVYLARKWGAKGILDN